MNKSNITSNSSLKIGGYWLSKKKVEIPRLNYDLVNRDRLIVNIKSNFEKNLICITGPAGFGKTTLLSQLKDNINPQKRKLAYIQLSDADNEIPRLIAYIGFALDYAGCSIPNMANYIQHEAPLDMITYFTNCIDEYGYHIILVFDEIQVLSRDTVNSVIDPLFSIAPENLTIIISGRNADHFNLAKFQIQDQVFFIEFNDLNFTKNECTSHLKDIYDISTAEYIYDYTNGWPAGVELARIKGLQNTRCITNEDFPFPSSINDFIKQNIVADICKYDLRSISALAICIKITQGSARTLLSEGHSSNPIKVIYNKYPGLFTRDESEDSYNLIPIFKDYFISDLSTFSEDLFKEYHEKLANQFKISHSVKNAVWHYVNASNISEACKVVEQEGGLSLFLRKGMSSIRSICNWLEPYYEETTPKIRLLFCLIKIKDGDFVNAESDILFIKSSAEKLLENESNSYPKAVILNCNFLIDLLKAYKGEDPGIVDNSHTMPTEFSADLYAGHVNTTLFGSKLVKGDFSSAAKYGEKTLQYFGKANSDYGLFYAYLHHSILGQCIGDEEKIRSALKDANKLLSVSLSQDKDARLIYRILNAEMKWLTGARQGVQSIHSIPSNLEKSDAWEDMYLCGYLLAANVTFEKYGFEEAEKY